MTGGLTLIYKTIEDIQKYIESHYRVNVGYCYLIETLEQYKTEYNADLNPDFQRGHVWTKKQQIKYIEYKLQNGPDANLIQFNCVGWMNDFRGPFQLIDGLQRITAVKLFIQDKLKVFGNYCSEFPDHKAMLRRLNFIFTINNLETRKDVLTWYIQINAGGTPHSRKEIARVQQLLDNEG